MDWIDFLSQALPNLLLGFPGHRPGGLVLSLLLGGSAVAVGLVVAITVGTARASRELWLRWPALAFIEVTRALPLVILMIVIHSLGTRDLVGVDLIPLQSAWIALLLYTAAYQSEIVRAGLQAIPEIQRDSARGSGLRRLDILRLIELPQALRLMFPALVGQTISLFKDTSVVLVLGVAELMTITKSMASAGNEAYFLGLYGLAGLLYFIVALGISRLARRSEAVIPGQRLLWLALES